MFQKRFFIQIRGPWRVEKAVHKERGSQTRLHLQHFSASPSPLGTNWVLEVIGTGLELGLEGFGTKGLEPGL